MEILNFEKKHVTEATTLALTNYYDERRYVKELPQVREIPDLNVWVENGLGVVAFENGKIIGFLCCCEPFDNAFRATDARGFFRQWVPTRPFLKIVQKYMSPCIKRQRESG